MGKTSYCSSWEKDFTWLSKYSPDDSKAYCKVCNKPFRISGSGVAQVRSHDEGDRHKKLKVLFESQRTFVGTSGKLSSGSFTLSSQDQVTRAEAVHSLFYVERNIPYSCSTEQSELFEILFPCKITQSFTCGATKMSYLVKHGLAPYFENQLMEDIDNVPFTFKFDETTTKQVKKQYDAYATYWSKSTDQVENAYLGSLFVGHCTAEDLVDHYMEFKQRWHFNDHSLLHVGMDGPSVNKSFEKKLSKRFETYSNAEILKLGTCSLHPVHSAFKKGLSELDISFDAFFHDLSFYFHLSSARREDYKSMEIITEVTAEYVKKHGPTRWLSMKPVGARILEQIENLREYFLNFLPNKAKGFKKCERYERIVKVLKRDDLEAYLAFMLFFCQDFESFLREFQFSIPMIHILWPKMAELTRNLMQKFVSKKKIISKDTPVSNQEIFNIDVSKGSNLKEPSLIDIGTKAKKIFSGGLISSEDENSFRRKCLKCFQVSVQYLLDHLPHDKKLIEYAQFLHPMKRNAKGAMNGISNSALYIAKCLGEKRGSVFKCDDEDLITDKVRAEWSKYQLEEIPEEWYIISDEDKRKKSSQSRKRYWDYAYEVCGLKTEEEPTVKFKRIDHFWRTVGKIVDENGKPKYPHLFAMVKCILCLSHGNAIPERGFSINKRLIEAHGTSIGEDTIQAHRIVKDAIAKAGGVKKVEITRSLLQSVKDAHSKAKIQAQMNKEKEDLVAKEKAAREERKKKTEELETIDSLIRKCQDDISTAESGTVEANKELGEAILKNDMKAVKTAHARLAMSVDAKKRWSNDLKELQEKKKQRR